MNTPVAFLIFNRPDTTARVFAAIRDARPPQLFVIADGPRADRPGEAELCAAARAIAQNVDWPCDVRTNFADANMGCGPRPASGLDWVFAQTEEAIILEDDCVPHPTFFSYCEEMLARYRHDPRVFTISGDCFHARRQTADSYYFGWRPFCWGWATWRRAWQHFDFDMTEWPALRDAGWPASVFPDKQAASEWTARFDDAHGAGKSHIWDFQWVFASLRHNGLCAMPAVNLVSNIGAGAGATHTGGGPGVGLRARAMEFPLRHPVQIAPNRRLQIATERVVSPGLPRRALGRLRRIVLRSGA